VTPESLFEWENRVVLLTTQALLGMVSERMWAVSIDVTLDRIVVHFAVDELDAEMEQDIEEITSDLDAFLVPAVVEIERLVYVGEPGRAWPGAEKRQVYRAKPRSNGGAAPPNAG
jgi:hypothetical protein